MDPEPVRLSRAAHDAVAAHGAGEPAGRRGLPLSAARERPGRIHLLRKPADVAASDGGAAADGGARTPPAASVRRRSLRAARSERADFAGELARTLSAGEDLHVRRRDPDRHQPLQVPAHI